MDGKGLLYRLRTLLDQDELAGDVDVKTAYGLLYDAAIEFVNRTSCLTSSQTVTTVSDQAEYTLSADYLKLYLINSSHKYIVKYQDASSNVSFPTLTDYGKVFNKSTNPSQNIPSNFAVTDNQTLSSRITGTTTSAGALSAGESTLTDTAADFSNVSAGDTVHNVTDNSSGIILSKTSSTVLITALFGNTNKWGSGDSYVIQPQGRMIITLDPPPANSGHTLIVPYVQRPAPVYSDYGVYRFQPQYGDALVKYAMFLYKYKDANPNFGDRLYQIFDNKVRTYGYQLNKTFNRGGLVMDLKE